MNENDLRAAASRRSATQFASIAESLRDFAADAGVSQRKVAGLTGLSTGFVSDVLAGRERASITTYNLLAAALGADLSIKLYQNTGPHLRDRWQAPMLEELLRIRHPRWEPYPEARVTDPVRGWIDVALHERRERVLVATELQSELRRLEQLIRWQASKAASLPSWAGFAHLGEQPALSQLLIVRRTRTNRAVVAEFGRQVQAAFPAHPDDAIAALTGVAPWPGAAMAWMIADEKGARFVPGR
jgi:transcriptional regulator with XRE-family HTH domain